MPKASTKSEYNFHRAGDWIATAVGKTLEGTRWVSEKLFILIKLFAATSLFIIVIFLLVNAFKDREKISVQPFSVPEEMQKDHKAAGSIIANIIKQKLRTRRADIDASIEDLSGEHEANKTLVSHGKGVFKGENIKLPETGISINDVIEFLSGLFGRKNITGSIYEDNNTLYLQIEIAGDIFTTGRSIKDKEQTSSLHIDLIEEMADDATHDILIMASEKYRLYFFCTDDHSHSGGDFEHPGYKELFELCNKVNRNLPNVPESIQKELENRRDKDNLSDSSNIEQYILATLANKIGQSAITSSSNVDHQTTPSVSEEIKKVALEPQDSHGNGPSTPSPGELHDTDADTDPSKSKGPDQEKMDNIKQRLTTSKLLQLEKACKKRRKANRIVSNAEEKEAGIAYKNEEFSNAEKAYIRAIEANCSNPYAWANLGILLSDLRNNVHFDPIEAAVALNKAIELKPKAGWMRHSLCVAEAYNKEERFEEAIHSQPCRKARSVEPGKQLVYDKLFNIAIADKYNHLKKYKEAFKFYKKAIEMDPKRTCRMKSVVEQMDSIKAKTTIKNLQHEICDALSNAYPAAKPDEACEETLIAYQDDHC